MVACDAARADFEPLTLKSAHVVCEENNIDVQSIVLSVQADSTVSALFNAAEWSAEFAHKYRPDKGATCLGISAKSTGVQLAVYDRSDRFMYRLKSNSISDIFVPQRWRAINGFSDIHQAESFKPLIYCAAAYDQVENERFLLLAFQDQSVLEAGRGINCYDYR